MAHRTITMYNDDDDRPIPQYIQCYSPRLFYATSFNQRYNFSENFVDRYSAVYFSLAIYQSCNGGDGYREKPCKVGAHTATSILQLHEKRFS